MKHARANYAIFTKLVKLQDERNLFEFISMQIEGFGQTFMKFIDSSDV